MAALAQRVVGKLRFQYCILKDPRFAAWYSGHFIHKEYHIPTDLSETKRVPILNPQTGERIKDCVQYAIVGVLQCVEQADEHGNSDDHIRLWLLRDDWGWNMMVEAFKGDFKYVPQHNGQERIQMFDGTMAEAWQFAQESQDAR